MSDEKIQETLDSILLTTKKILGLDAEYDAFDVDIITHINSVFFTLHQNGVGPAEGFSIVDESSKWEEFTGTEVNLHAVRSYVPMKVRLAFDPPGTSNLVQSMEEMCKEYEWRLYIAADPVTHERIEDE